MKTLKVGIASLDEMKERTMKIARGELKPGANDPKVWFTSTESFAKVLSNKNRALLELIAATQPQSLHDLAERTGRAPGNLSRTLKTMERYGFVRLHRGARGRIRPEVPYKAISLTLSVRRNERSRPVRTAGVSGHISDRQRSEGRMSNLSCPAKYFHLSSRRGSRCMH